MKKLVVDDGDRIGELSTSNKSIDGNLSKDVLKEGSIGTPCLFLISGCWNGQYKRALVQLQPTIVIKPADCAALLGPSRPRTQLHLQTSCTYYCETIAKWMCLLMHTRTSKAADADVYMFNSRYLVGISSTC